MLFYSHTAPRAARMRVTEAKYRGKSGFMVSGTDSKGRTGQRIFVRTRSQAERLRDLKNGPHADDQVDAIIREVSAPSGTRRHVVQSKKVAFRRGDRIRLSGGKILTYAGLARGGSWDGLEKWIDADAPDGEGIPMYVAEGFVRTQIRRGVIRKMGRRE